MEVEVLKQMEDEQNYPPKFRVVINCSPAAQQSQARIQFKGAHKELVFDIPLALQPGINLEQCCIKNTHGLSNFLYTTKFLGCFTISISHLFSQHLALNRYTKMCIIILHI